MHHSYLHRSFLRYSLLLGMTGLFMACDDCGLREEPELTIIFESANQQAVRVDTAYAPGSTWSVKNIALGTQGSGVLIAPLDLNTDSTRYMLRVNGQRGVLTVRYKRDFQYQSEECGYVLVIRPPGNLPKEQFATTTIGKIIPNTDNPSAPLQFGGVDPSGMWLLIRL